MLLFSISTFAQTSRTTLSEVKIVGFTSVEHNLTIYHDSGDSLQYVYLRYQDSDYQYITKRESIMISSERILLSLISDLKVMLTKITTKENFSFSHGKYKLTCYDFSKYLYIGDGDSNTKINQKQAQKLLTWLELIYPFFID